jgi:HK97 family phage prohead protease
MTAVERRMAVTGLEIRDGDSGLTLTGYASTFNQPYDMGWYEETVDSGAFSRTLGTRPDVRLLVNHDGLPLARTTSGTLTLDTDTRGLRVSANLDPSDPDVASLAPKMRRGDLNQMSFGFRTVSDMWEDDMTKRTLRELDLNDGDVSVVTYPANPGTSAVVRSDGLSYDGMVAAIDCLKKRAAPNEDILSVITRALGYFTAIDTIVDNAQDELAEVLGIPNPDDDEMGEPMTSGPDAEALAARRATRARLLALL